jgi:hypothetical protein
MKVDLCRSKALLVIVITFVALTVPSRVAFGQNWSFDARTIGMGGVGSTGNLADSMIDKQRRYTSIVLPFGLFQVLGDLDIYDPNSPNIRPDSRHRIFGEPDSLRHRTRSRHLRRGALRLRPAQCRIQPRLEPVSRLRARERHPR